MVFEGQESGLLIFQVKIRIVDLIYGGQVMERVFHLATSCTLSLNASMPSPRMGEVVE